MVRLYHAPEVCDKVNASLGLTGRELLCPHHLQYWVKKGLIPPQHGGRRKLRVYDEQSVKNIEQLAFVHLSLGVKLDKVKEAIKFLESK